MLNRPVLDSRAIFCIIGNFSITGIIRSVVLTGWEKNANVVYIKMRI